MDVSGGGDQTTKDTALKRLFSSMLCLLALLSLMTPALAQQELVSDPEVYEKVFFQKQCKVTDFGPDYISRIDINNDGLMDAVTNRGALTCDGHKSTTCNDDGCPYNFYVQVKEGGYLLIATATIYGYDFIQRFGNMVFVLKMHPRYCDRTDSVPCEMTVRVRGTSFVTLSRK